jgi:hypothetical protein
MSDDGMQNDPTASDARIISLRELLMRSFGLFAENQRKLIILAIIWAAYNVIEMILFELLPVIYPAELSNSIPYSMLELAIIILAESILVNIIIVASYMAIKGQNISLKDCAIRAVRVLPAFIVTAIILISALLLGFLALVIPFFIIYVYFNFALYFVVIYRIYNFKAMHLSREIVRGRWWAVLGRILIPNLISLILSIILTVLTSEKYINVALESLPSFLIPFGAFTLLSVMSSIFVVIFELILMEDLIGKSNLNHLLSQEQPLVISSPEI